MRFLFQSSIIDSDCRILGVDDFLMYSVTLSKMSYLLIKTISTCKFQLNEDGWMVLQLETKYETRMPHIRWMPLT